MNQSYDIKNQFPQLKSLVNQKPLVYFDNAATTLKPLVFIESISSYYREKVANVHRGVHFLSEDGTRKFEETRIAVKNFINARDESEVIFTKGTTESLNLVAQCFGKKFLAPGDEIVLSLMEHHSNIVPWQLVAELYGATIKVVGLNSKGEIDLDEYRKILGKKTKIVSISHISNTLGTINPIKEMVAMAHEVGAVFCVDAAQSAAHLKLDVQELNCDFLAFSAHKVFGPNGVGILYGKKEILIELPPYQGGGAMISEVTFKHTSFNTPPFKFEAGTPAIAEVISFQCVLEYLEQIGLETIANIEHELLTYATNELKNVPGIRIYGESPKKSAVITFSIDGIHCHDLGTLLDKYGVAIRTGHHCTQPLLAHFGLTAAARVSFAFYNTKEEIDYFISSLNKAIEFLK